MDATSDDMIELKRSIDRQNELQAETQATLRDVARMLQENSRATADVLALLRKKAPDEPSTEIRTAIDLG
ncbi:MAG: hypothetical protein ACAH27_15470 [Xanthobacteraceae bacterium]